MAEAPVSNRSAKPRERNDYMKAYNSRPETKEKNRAAAAALSRIRKIASTKARFEELAVPDLLSIAIAKCAETGVSYEENKIAFETVFKILHGE